MADFPTVESVFEDVRRAFEAKRGDAHERLRMLRAALDSYTTAVEAEVATDFAARNGLEWRSSAGRAMSAALSLRSLVEALPELRGQSLAAREAAAAAPATMRKAPMEPQPPASTAAPAATAPLPESVFEDESDAEAVELQKMMKELDLERMPEPLFRAWAEELAAKARMIQERVKDEEIPAQIIKQLTVVTTSRHLQGVYGLQRKHTANWKELAAEAEKERRSLESALPKSQPIRKIVRRDV